MHALHDACFAHRGVRAVHSRTTKMRPQAPRMLFLMGVTAARATRRRRLIKAGDFSDTEKKHFSGPCFFLAFFVVFVCGCIFEPIKEVVRRRSYFNTLTSRMSNKNAACAEKLALEAELQQAREEIARLVVLQGESQREAAAAKAELEEAREEIARLAVLHGESQWEIAATKAELNLVVLQNVQLVANQGQSQPALKGYEAAKASYTFPGPPHDYRSPAASAAHLRRPVPLPPQEWKAHGAFLASCPQDLQQAKGRGDQPEADDHGHGLPRSKSASDKGAFFISPVQPALNTFECGFVGLVVTSSPPHRVKRVHGLLDRHCVRHDQHGYRNCGISEDDRILQVDGVNVERMDVTTLQRMLCGPLHSTAVITLARHSTGEVYSIEALRHRDPSSDHSLSQGLPSISRSMAQWTMWEEAAAKEEVAAQVVAHATVTMDAERASPTGASEHMMLSHRPLSSGSSKEVQTPHRSGSLDATLAVAQVAHALSDSFVASLFGPRPASAAALRASPGFVTLQMPCGASCRVPSLRCSKQARWKIMRPVGY